MAREGRYFEVGFPHFKGGVAYGFPDESREYMELLVDRRVEMGDHLLDKLREYIPEFKVSTITPSYPYIQRCERGVVLHLGDGGRWIDVVRGMGGHFLSEHNLDSFKDRAVAMNIGADALEYLDESIRAPRILVEDASYVLNYPLPVGVDRLSGEEFSEATIKRVYEISDLAQDVTYSGDGPQTISNSQGTIGVEEGALVGRGFEGWNAGSASWVMSMLMRFSKPE